MPSPPDENPPPPLARDGMSGATTRAQTRAETRTERLQRWIAATSSALLHAFFLFLLLYASRPLLSPPQGASSGGRVKVDFIGATRQDSQRPPTPPSGTARPVEHPRPRKPVPPRTETSPVQAAVVARADNPLPPDEKPQPPVEDAVGQPRPSEAPASAPAPDMRRSAAWGQPPGLLPRETAPTNNGADQGAASYSNAGRDVAGEPTVQVGGFQIYYELLREAQLRAWRDRGMTEVSFPLPGLRQYMVCPLQIVLRRGSGGCRLVEPDDPGMAAIGDAREVVIVQRVYRRGELVWRGPGVYK